MSLGKYRVRWVWPSSSGGGFVREQSDVIAVDAVAARALVMGSLSERAGARITSVLRIRCRPISGRQASEGPGAA